MPNHKRAFISCIHGNLPALETVLSEIEKQGIQSIYCLGDMTGYGPWPNEVISLLEDRKITSIKGCWEDALLSSKDDCGCTFTSPEEHALGELAFDWTKRELNFKSRAFLQKLPKHLEGDFDAGRILLVHGSPKSPYEYLQESTHELVLLERAASAACDILVCGHTHIPFVKDVKGELVVTTQSSLDGEGLPRKDDLVLKSKRIVNAGSVGEPRHGGAELSWVTIDLENGDAEVHFCKYDINKTIREMRHKMIPKTLIERFTESQEMTGKKKDLICDC